MGGQKYWQNVIDKFYEKYEGIYNYHVSLIREATTTGAVVSNSGRIYKFQPRMKRGVLTWPENEIVNFPVQGFATDLMSIARVSAWNRLKAERESGEVLFVNTVHDSLKLDLNCDIKRAVEIGGVVKSSFQDIPANYERIYGERFLVPMDCDFKVGVNDLWQHKIDLTR